MKIRHILITALSFFFCACRPPQAGNSQPSTAWYEIFTASFYDSDGDGIGDLRGITKKLDYLNDGKQFSHSSLHIDGIWLMPIMPSPSYHKYDVSDFYNIDPSYGSLADFDALAAECKRRGVRLIIDLTLNHTSREHPWFLAAREEARRGEAGFYSNFYNITQEKKAGFHSLGIAGWYYEGVFSPDMPDLNFDNMSVRAEFEKIAAFWLERGADGFRLDAAKHVYHSREKNVELLQWFSSVCRKIKPDAYLVGEVWSDDAEIIALYKSGIPSLFNFGFAGRDGHLGRAILRKDGFNFAREVVRWDTLIHQANPAAIDAPFLSNHDTDRFAGFFDGAQRKIAASLYLFMPGNPFIYYGEEIGMTGSGRDENKRGAMIWSTSNNTGKTRGPSGADRLEDVTAGIAESMRDRGSLLSFYIQALNLKKRYPVIAYGKPEALPLDNKAIAALRFEGGANAVCVLHNLSNEKVQITIPGAKKIGGFLAALPGGAKPVLRGNSLTLGAYCTVILEMW